MQVILNALLEVDKAVNMPISNDEDRDNVLTAIYKVLYSPDVVEARIEAFAECLRARKVSHKKAVRS